MILYLVFMGFDLAGRFMIPIEQPEVAQAKTAETAAAAEQAKATQSEAQAFDDNGDAIPINRSGFDDPNDASTSKTGKIS